MEVLLIDKHTGEEVDGYIIQSQDDVAKKIQDKKEKEKIKQKNIEYGKFVWVFYNNNQLLFNGSIDGSILTKFIYLSTYAEYSDKSCGTFSKIVSDRNVHINKKDLGRLLKTKTTATNHFIKECISKNLINIDEDGFLFINTNYVKYGKLLDTNVLKECRTSRMYKNAVRDLYKKSLPSEHKLLSYLFIILPFVNHEYNIICHNPEEVVLENIQQMDLMEFCEIIGYSKNNYRRLKSLLKNITVLGKYAISFVENLYGVKMFINPKLYYAGESWDEVKILGEF